MQMELQEAKDELKNPKTQATVDEAVSHLNAAVVVIVLSSDAFTMFSSVAWNLYVTSLYPSAVSVMVQYPVPSVPSGSVQRREH